MRFAPIATGIVIVVLISIVFRVWFYPSPGDSAIRMFEAQYREIALQEHYDALESLRCTPKGGASVLSRSIIYFCDISTACGEKVTQKIEVDRVLGTQTDSEPFYLKFAKTCSEILNEETAAKAAARNDQDG